MTRTPHVPCTALKQIIKMELQFSELIFNVRRKMINKPVSVNKTAGNDMNSSSSL